MTFKTSPAGRLYIEKDESFSPKPVYDVSGYSSGYGHYWGTCTKGDFSKVPEEYRNGMTLYQADTIMTKDLDLVEEYINKYLHPDIPIDQAKFDKLVDFGYNAGIGSLNIVLHFMNNGHIVDAYNELKSIIHGEGHKVLPALVKRRNDEIKVLFPGMPLITITN